ncbi:Polyadenylation factor I complex, subunit FIP1 [Trachipleistophora hominis]|uniref:Polyadenylation factor I complex, subunit FIP1 n=1 Tax=Trachipleistophora hominis TaxID=72359 RepID=L7JS81_TRAHO|nr:Polyadenylation factor I complex, subunit FIP1 [Trachipleistophora hominis]
MNDDILYDVNLDDQSSESSTHLEVIAEQSRKEVSAIPEMPTIAGKNLFEFEIDTIEDKPWRRPGADITDYFNYGFDEHTWKLYCAKQRSLKEEYKDDNKETGEISPSKERRRAGKSRDEYRGREEYKRRHGYN